MWRISRMLDDASQQDREDFAKILKTTQSGAKDLIDRLESLARSVFRLPSEKPVSYRTVVLHVAAAFGVGYARHSTTKVVEVALANKILKTAWERSTPEQRAEFERKWAEEARRRGLPVELAGPAGLFTTIGAAQLSGFGIYMLASTALGAITAAIGITLPFAAYAAMSSAIAVLIGPAGWIGAGIVSLIQLARLKKRVDKEQLKRLLGAVLFILALRSRSEAAKPANPAGTESPTEDRTRTESPDADRFQCAAEAGQASIPGSPDVVEFGGVDVRTDPVGATHLVSAAQLGEWRRSLIRLLKSLDKAKSDPSSDGPSDLMFRLSRDGVIPRHIVALMRVVTEMRNSAEYDSKVLSFSESEAARSAWTAICEWHQQVR